jgi:hypothetical protein
MNIPKRPPSWFLPGFLLFVLLFFYLNLFVLGATPILSHNGDQFVFLSNACRMLDGQVIYRDFFQFTPPGTELVYWALFKLFGVWCGIPNVMLLLLVLGFTWLSIVIARTIFEGWTAYLPALLFVLTAFLPVLDGTHHWYSLFAAMAAVALIIKRRSLGLIAGAGALCGLASFFSQNHGVSAVAGLSAFLVWEDWRERRGWRLTLRRQGILCGAFSLAVAAFHGYFVWKVGLQRYLYCLVVFGAKYYPADRPYNSIQSYMLEPPQFLHWYNLPWQVIWFFTHALIPFVYMLFFIRLHRDAGLPVHEPWSRLMLINMMGLFLFLSVAPAPFYTRLCYVSLPALIIFVWFLNQSGRFGQVFRRLVWIGSLAWMVGMVCHRQEQWRGYITPPTGRTALLDRDEWEEYDWFSRYSRPSEYVLDCGGKASFLYRLKGPSEAPFLSNTDYTRPEQVLRDVEGLEKYQAMTILCYDILGVGPALEPDDHLGPLRAYIHTHFHLVKAFPGGDLVWERNSKPMGGGL